MIGRIRGRLVEKQPSLLLVDVQGVGYEIEVPFTTSFALSEINQDIILHTHLVVREDAQLLYGFSAVKDRDLFRLLIKINGVGPKLALTILSGLDSTQLARCVRDDDSATLVKLPGVGKKTAERLLIELRDKLKDWGLPDHDLLAGEESAPAKSASSVIEEAESALIALGYKPQEATKAVNAVKVDGLSSEELIRLALKGMVRGN
ncbi:Holliday junction branch migration protein RuvA [Alkalimarinus sediminis]|uniref:Holliday junction branch migration complex subunit RuvA n=1 Tax=Alkalimarinus sediminis TaxID=1632866 RepID=A0A9E8KQG4_9ALTE|nr:Holliday junction branch migration protein RuvA [Alkalimarinus sediminis]UZW75814.1 Holliday junction branch migration protein RuvA [Alkalimarinus sediminis]